MAVLCGLEVKMAEQKLCTCPVQRQFLVKHFPSVLGHFADAHSEGLKGVSASGGNVAFL